MNMWPFVIAAYSVTLGGAALIGGWSWWAMRRAEAAVEDLRQR